MKEFHRRKNRLLFLGDILALTAALFLTLTIRYRELPSSELLGTHLVPFSLLFVVWALVFFIVGLYDETLSFDRKRLPGLVLKTQVVNVLLGFSLFFLLPFSIAPKTNLLIYLGISTLLIILWRLYIYPRLQPPRSVRVLLVGTGRELKSVQELLNGNPYFKQVSIEHIDTGVYTDTDALSKSLDAYVSEQPVDIVVADLYDPVMQKLAGFFFNLTLHSTAVKFFTLSDFYERLFHRLPPSVVRDSWMLEHMSTQSPHYAYDLLKRLIDIVGSCVLLIPGSLVLATVALCIRIENRGPIFYKSIRIGQHNQPVTIIKFRTMTGMDVGREALHSSLVVTPLGQVLRRFRLDELPQLLNVLKGELSFIGPRPEMPALVEVYEKEIPYYNLRHLVKPGLSGWAQINNLDAPRQGVDVPRTIEKLALDLYYLRHRSFLLDIEIALKTINTVLSRTGT